ncbi:MAG: hypothetical protein LUQ38_01705 [Methanotrichaceae archaeon]|nr:hypothetical protein [Methanotrichaceae archaeon]
MVIVSIMWQTISGSAFVAQVRLFLAKFIHIIDPRIVAEDGENILNSALLARYI